MVTWNLTNLSHKQFGSSLQSIHPMIQQIQGGTAWEVISPSEFENVNIVQIISNTFIGAFKNLGVESGSTVAVERMMSVSRIPPPVVLWNLHWVAWLMRQLIDQLPPASAGRSSFHQSYFYLTSCSLRNNKPPAFMDVCKNALFPFFLPFSYICCIINRQEKQADTSVLFSCRFCTFLFSTPQTFHRIYNRKLKKTKTPKLDTSWISCYQLI